jgi:7-cyano-7-deazaguanine reductase
MKDETFINSPLGKQTFYDTVYDPSLLCPLPRDKQRQAIGIADVNLPFQGYDVWNAYELSWLNVKGKPLLAIGEFFFPCQSPYIVESKSFKLYLNSFHQTTFANLEDVQAILEKDLAKCVGQSVKVNLIQSKDYASLCLKNLPGFCLDNLDIETNLYAVDPSILGHAAELVEEEFYSNLLKSNCPVTKQPDWASLYIHYIGPKINKESLLKYIISFRSHYEFGEHCIERIFMDLQKYCRCHKLTIYGRYTRRGGIDLNPFRSNFESFMRNIRDYRQ